MRPSLFVFMLFMFPAFVFAQVTGTLEGRVVDEANGEPLIGARVFVVETEQGALSDDDGRYVIRNLPLGTYTLKATYLGYADFVQYQLRLESGNTTFSIKMKEVGSEIDAVVIKAAPFQRSSSELVSTRSIGLEQIQANPGGNQDISRALQSLPGVGASAGFRNDLIIRGGAPNENVFYLDGIEVPNINHFATQGSGGGPQGLIPSYLIERVSFQTSGFGAQYDNTLSSVLDFDLQSANSERFQNLITASATEFGLAFDTPIGKKVKVTSSIRRSYLDLLFKVIDLPFLPEYFDAATKVDWQISPRTKLTYLHIGAWDNFKRNYPEDPDLETQALIDALPTITQRTFTQGVNLRHSTKQGAVSLALSRNFLFNNVTRAKPLTDPEEKLLDYQSFEAETKLRLNGVETRGPWEFRYGGTAQHVQYHVDSKGSVVIPVQADDGSYYGVEQLISQDDKLEFWRWGLHGSVSRRFRRFRSTFGLRTDGNSFTEEGANLLATLSPRLSLSYALTEKWTANASTGVYYKLPSYTVLGYAPEGRFVNQGAKYVRSIHYVAGLEYKPADNWILTLEGFYKDYSDYPVSLRSGLSLANLGGDFSVFGNEPVRSVGNGRSYGVEFFAQKLLTDRLYGVFAYTLFWSEFTGVDTATGRPNDRYVRSAWDNRHLISLTGGYRFGKNKSWEFSARLRVLGPSPYTPWNIELSREVYPITGEGQLDWTRLNAAETDWFNVLDVRIDKRWFFPKWSLNLFLDIQNVANSPNAGPARFTLRRTDSGSFETGENNWTLLKDAGASVLPSIGVRIKFGY